jgi:hypothetical protein
MVSSKCIWVDWLNAVCCHVTKFYYLIYSRLNKIRLQVVIETSPHVHRLQVQWLLGCETKFNIQLLPCATLRLMLITLQTCLNTSLRILIPWSNMISICLEYHFNMLHTCSQHSSNDHHWKFLKPSPDMNALFSSSIVHHL